MKPEVQITTAGQRLTQRDLQRGIWINIIAGALGMMWVACAQGMPITMFLEALGASGFQLGLLVTVLQVSMIMQIPGAWFVERLAERKRFWIIGSFIQRTLWLVPALLIFLYPNGLRSPLGPWLILGVVAVSTLINQSVASSWFSWMADLIPAKIQSRFWGLRQSLVMTAYLGAMWLAGYLLDQFSPAGVNPRPLTGFAVVFILATITGCISTLIYGGIPEVKKKQRMAGHSLWHDILAPLRNRDFRNLTLGFGAWQFAVATTGAFGIVYLKEEFGVSYSQLAAVNISATIGVIVAGIFWGRIMDLIGTRTVGALAILLGSCVTGVWFCMFHTQVDITLPFLGAISMPQPVFILLFVNFLAGIMFSAVGICQLSLLGTVTPAEGRTMAMAVHWTLVGCISATGPLFGGMIVDWMKAHPAILVIPGFGPLEYIHVLALIQLVVSWLVAVPLLLRITKRGRELPVYLLVGNPLRSISIVHGLMSMAAAVSPGKRARAVRKLGKKKTSEVVGDLVSGLNDPAVDVREESAFALADIGTPDALAALVQKLNDPDSDLAPQIARALRRRKNSQTPDTVNALVRKLADPDRETRSESARTLGEIGDQSVSGPLLSMLQSASHSKDLSASSEALARLGEVAAVYEILPRMKKTRNPVLKRSLAVAVGDLLSREVGTFYPLLIREQENSGSAMRDLLKKLRKTIRSAGRNADGETVARMLREAETLESAYEDEEFQQAADRLFFLAEDLARVLYPGENLPSGRALVAELLRRDLYFGIGLWTLDFIRHCRHQQGTQPLDAIDILLEIHFLCNCPRPGHGPSRKGETEQARG